jgi:predicted ester cyclase
MLLPTPLEKNAGWPGEEGALVSSAEENKAIVRRFLEETAKENFDVIDELVDPDFVDLSLQPGQEPDCEGFKRSLAALIAPFSDVNITIDDQVAEGDKVITWYTGISTHDRGPFMGVAPTGKRNTFTDVVLHRVVGARSWRSGAQVTI